MFHNRNTRFAIGTLRPCAAGYLSPELPGGLPPPGLWTMRPLNRWWIGRIVLALDAAFVTQEGRPPVGNRRIWWGLAIMAAGLCAAWPFRKSWLEEQDALVTKALAAPAVLPTSQAPPPSRLPPPRHDDQDETSPALTPPPLTSHPPVLGLHPLTSALDRGITQRSLVRIDRLPQAPTLATDFSTAPPSSSLDPRAAILAETDSPPLMTSEPAPPRHQRRYRILKHDTLESIAERLLGSREHAGKLLAANANVILAPEVLPVGATIIIPELSLPSESFVRLPENGM
jgi:hypothetical protein